jgi:hypothetical protein
MVYLNKQKNIPWPIATHGHINTSCSMHAWPFKIENIISLLLEKQRCGIPHFGPLPIVAVVPHEPTGGARGIRTDGAGGVRRRGSQWAGGGARVGYTAGRHWG